MRQQSLRLLLAPPFGDGTLTPMLASLFGLIHGFGNGITQMSFKAVPAKFFGRTHLGAIGGVLSTLNMASTAVGPLVVGVSYDILGSYRAVVRVIGLCTACFAFAVLGMRVPTRSRAAVS